METTTNPCPIEQQSSCKSFLSGWFGQVPKRDAFGVKIEKFANGRWVPAPVQTTTNGTYSGLVDGDVYSILLTSTHDTECDVELKIDSRVVGTFRVPAHREFRIERGSEDVRSFVFVKENSDNAKEAGIVTGESKNGLVEATFKPRIKTAGNWLDFRVTKKRDDFSYSGPTTKGHNGLLGSSGNNTFYEQSLESMRYDCDVVSKGVPMNLGTSNHPRRQPEMMMENVSKVTSNSSNLNIVGGGATALGQNTSQQFRTVQDIPENEIDKAKVEVRRLRLVAVAPKKLESISTATFSNASQMGTVDPVPPRPTF